MLAYRCMFPLHRRLIHMNSQPHQLDFGNTSRRQTSASVSATVLRKNDAGWSKIRQCSCAFIGLLKPEPRTWLLLMSALGAAVPRCCSRCTWLRRTAVTPTCVQFDDIKAVGRALGRCHILRITNDMPKSTSSARVSSLWMKVFGCNGLWGIIN
jgi:hypothetical protein